ncbi:hypothetical protein B0A55_07757, partial [Friedmanniomyces simplex]
MPTPILLIVTSTLTLLLYLHFTNRKRPSLPVNSQVPIGPPGKPLVGNLLEIPPYHSWFKFTEWSKQYGPLYRLNLAGQTHFAYDTQLELTGRPIALSAWLSLLSLIAGPHLSMAFELVSHSLRPVFMPYGETWRQVRKLMHRLTNVTVATTYESLQEEESVRVFERYSAGLVLRLAYSKPVHTGEESFVRRIFRVAHTVERVASPGAYLVDAFPILLHLPTFLAPFKREARRLHNEEINLFRSLLHEGVKASEINNTVPASANFCGKWAQNPDLYDLTYDHVAYAIGTLFEAGAGTTTSAMTSFMLAMTLHQQEFAKLQQEVDAVTGGKRLPT